MSGFRIRRYLAEGIRLLRPLDFLVLIAAAGVIVAFSFLSIERGGPGTNVEIQTDAGRFVYSLDRDLELSFSGPIGESIVHIHDGAVRFVESPCRDNICVAAGALTEVGQWAACLPNRVFVSVVGDPAETGSVDATSF